MTKETKPFTITQDELQVAIKEPATGKNVLDPDGATYTVRMLICGAGNHALGNDGPSDTMRMARLIDKFALNGKGSVELDDDEIEDLTSRGHDRFKKSPLLYGNLRRILGTA